jgi:DNA-binding MarR family transcriptional regulator
VPRNADTEFGSLKSAKCDRGFYRQRAELIERVLFDRKLTPGHRVVMLGIVAMTDPESRQCDAGQSYLAKALNMNRKTVIAAMTKLVELGYVLRVARRVAVVNS